MKENNTTFLLLFFGAISSHLTCTIYVIYRAHELRRPLLDNEVLNGKEEFFFIINIISLVALFFSIFFPKNWNLKTNIFILYAIFFTSHCLFILLYLLGMMFGPSSPEMNLQQLGMLL